MKRHLKQFVKCELFPGQTPPPITNRRFYPTDEPHVPGIGKKIAVQSGSGKPAKENRKLA